MSRTLTRCTIALSAALMLVAFSASTSFAKSPGMADLTKAGQVGVGFNGNYNFTWTANDTESGAEATNTTVFLMLSPEVGYFFSDWLQVGLNVGAVLRPIQRDNGDKPLSTDWFATIGPKYHVRISDMLTFVPGLALGGYYGGASYKKPTQDDNTGLTTFDDVNTTTFGGIANGQLAFNYLVGDRTSMVAGVMANFLFGAENINDVSRGVTTFNTTVNLGVFHYF